MPLPKRTGSRPSQLAPWTWLRAPRWSAVLAAAALTVLAGCTGSGDLADAAPTTPAPTTPAATTPSTEPVAATEEPSPTATAAEVPTASGDALGATLGAGALLTASDRGVDVVFPDGTSDSLTSIPARRAFDDGAGGVVFQGVAPPQPNAPSAAIMWLPPDGSDAVTVVPDGLADEVTLHGAGLIDGQPSAFFTVRVGAGSPTRSTETLDVVDVTSGERRTVADVGAWESGVAAVSWGGDMFAMDQALEAMRWFAFLDSDGRPVTVSANPVTESDPCVDDARCPWLVTIDPSGERLAWIVPGEIRVVDADNGDVLAELPLPSTDMMVSHLALAGDTLVVNRFVPGDDADAENLAAPLIYDLTDPEQPPVEGDAAAFTTVVGG